MQTEKMIGHLIPVEGKCPLVIRGFTSDKKVILKQTRPAIRKKDLLQHFKEEMIAVGNVLKLPSGILIELTKDRNTGYWENVVAGFFIEVTPEKLEGMLSDYNAFKIASTVSSKCGEHPGRLKFLPKKTEESDPNER